MKRLHILSNQNVQFKRWKKLLTKKGRQKEGTMLVEGEHLLYEAIRSQRVHLQNIIIEERRFEEWSSREELQKYPIYTLPSTLFQMISETEETQGVIAEICLPSIQEEMSSVLRLDNPFLLLLDRVQDPGNLGTLFRTAQAAGVTGIVVGKGTVDPFNGKVVRSSMGAIFHVPIFGADLKEVIPLLQQANISIIGTSLRAKTTYYQASYERCAILLGNEGKGVAPSLLQMVDQDVFIPMPGGTESLNVAIAGALLLYERVRQMTRRE